jgi:hypothetical protein
MRFKGKISKWFYGIMIFVAAIVIPIIILAIKDEEMLVLVIILGIFSLIDIKIPPLLNIYHAELPNTFR